jgi:hypothetical protein
LSESTKYELNLSNEGALYILNKQTNNFHKEIHGDLGHNGPYQLYVNSDCTFVIKDANGFIQKKYGTSEKAVC